MALGYSPAVDLLLGTVKLRPLIMSSPTWLLALAQELSENQRHNPLNPLSLFDEVHDLAIIKASGIAAPPLSLGDSDTVQVGDTVYVTGNPDGYLGTFSTGVISAIRPSRKERRSGTTENSGDLCCGENLPDNRTHLFRE